LERSGKKSCITAIPICTGANDEKSRLLYEIGAAKALLERLQRKASEPEWKDTLESMKEPDGYFTLYSSALQDAADILQPSSGAFGKIVKLLMWQFQKDETPCFEDRLCIGQQGIHMLIW
jgi:hypothetical protein